MFNGFAQIAEGVIAEEKKRGDSLWRKLVDKHDIAEEEARIVTVYRDLATGDLETFLEDWDGEYSKMLQDISKEMSAKHGVRIALTGDNTAHELKLQIADLLFTLVYGRIAEIQLLETNQDSGEKIQQLR